MGRNKNWLCTEWKRNKITIMGTNEREQECERTRIGYVWRRAQKKLYKIMKNWKTDWKKDCQRRKVLKTNLLLYGKFEVYGNIEVMERCENHQYLEMSEQKDKVN